MRIALIDNYDSFTFNLFHMVKELGIEVDIFKNDKVNLNELKYYDGILLSPGPGLPNEAGHLLDIIHQYADSIPILGICLGEQAIAEAFGGKLQNLSQVYHGIQSEISILENDTLFKGLANKIKVGRYHSWVVSHDKLPECIKIISVSKENHIMAIRHKTKPVAGIQFHPESILTPFGKTILSNWINNI